MANADIKKKVEKLSEAMVLSDTTDLPALAQMHTDLTDIADWARSENRELTAAAALKAAELIESIILQEASEPDATLELVGKTLAVFQLAVEDDRSESELTFPVELGLDDPNGAGTEPPGGLQLPAHVDESIFADFLARQDSALEEMEGLILSLEAGAGEDTLPSLKRQIHTLKGESALLGLVNVEKLCHVVEDKLQDASAVTLVDFLLNMKDWLRRTFDAYAGKGAMPGGIDALLEQLSGASMPAAQETDTAPPTEAESASPTPPPDPAAKPPEMPESETEEEDLIFEPKFIDGDTDLLGDFVMEANEHLETADLQLLTLETDPQDEDAMNAVFRAFHTIKGVAGFLALDEIGKLSHESENLLDLARKGNLALTGPAIDVVFDAVDILKQLIDNLNTALSTGEPLIPNENLPELVRRIKRVAAGKEAVATEAVQRDKPVGSPRVGEILVDAGVATEEAVHQAIEQQYQPQQPKKLGEVLVNGAVVSTSKVNKALDVQKSEKPESKVGEILVGMGAAQTEDIERAAVKQQEPAKPPKLGEILVKSGEADARDISKALRAQRGQGDVIKVREAVKVDATRLDQMVDMIGELVIAESMVSQSPVLEALDAGDLMGHLGQLDKITRELQEMAMSLRMVPIRSTFQKMARLVRDLSKKTSKPVNFTMSGEDTELDKSVVDKIGDPLVHMVRNSIDHGLEDTPEERKKNGKPAKGNVQLRAFHEGGNIHIEIEDDGRGLNRDRIIDKAIERGIIQAGDSLSDREVWNLIFEPGFSTAKEVTAVSGRGVGMDVVKRNIDALRGQVDIQSVKGKGSIFTIRLPLTLAIIDGMVVRVGTENYILPTLSILISLRPTEKDVNSVVGKGEMLSWQEQLMPLFRMHELFNIEDAVTEPTEGTVVVVENDGKRVGLLVDEILGQQQIVIKSLGEVLQGIDGVAGGAIMPDGNVGLIVDIGGVIRIATETGPHKTKAE